MKTQIKNKEIAEQFADLADVFSETVDDEGLRVLASICLQLSDLDSCLVFTTTIGNSIEFSALVSNTQATMPGSTSDEPNTLSQLAMRSLRPEFSLTSVNSAIVTEFAFPLRVHGRALGAIFIEGKGQRYLSAETIAVIQSVADLSASAIYQCHQIVQTRTLVSQLKGALDSRVVLEQAKGILAERMKIDFPTAFQELRNTARREQRPIHHVAAEIVSTLNK
ncbi:unannotated protein [freshwater metagenome]|uniref:Unannotated protein n=1 Tax=freshwater metagenome TaxID=449393 RepID=A0A6J6FYD4_9ZZZZ